MQTRDIPTIEFLTRAYRAYGSGRDTILSSVPKYSISKIVDSVFSEGYIFRINQYIDYINVLFPDYRLSPVQNIYLDIVADIRHELDNDWLESRLSDIGLDKPDYLMYELANRIGNKNIYAIS